MGPAEVSSIESYSPPVLALSLGLLESSWARVQDFQHNVGAQPMR